MNQFISCPQPLIPSLTRSVVAELIEKGEDDSVGILFSLRQMKQNNISATNLNNCLGVSFNDLEEQNKIVNKLDFEELVSFAKSADATKAELQECKSSLASCFTEKIALASSVASAQLKISNAVAAELIANESLNECKSIVLKQKKDIESTATEISRLKKKESTAASSFEQLAAMISKVSDEVSALQVSNGKMREESLKSSIVISEMREESLKSSIVISEMREESLKSSIVISEMRKESLKSSIVISEMKNDIIDLQALNVNLQTLNTDLNGRVTSMECALNVLMPNR
jgi:hypothetical protein